MFIQNKYNKIYYNIINNAKSRQLTGYVERHHIIPKSLGGDNSKDNLAKLTAREHYICHLLLTKFTTGIAYQKMSYALHRVTNKSNSQIKSSKVYEMIRTAHATMLSAKLKGVTIQDRFGRAYSHPISTYQKDQIRKANSARIWTDEMRANMSKAKTGQSIKLPPRTKEHSLNISKARTNKTMYTFIHEIYGTVICARFELINLYPELNIKSTELGKVIDPTYREKSHRGWSVISFP